MESISKVTVPLPSSEHSLSESYVILLRHAESKPNEKMKEIRKREHTDEDLLRVKTNIEFQDSSITQLGITECEAAAEIAKTLKVEIVLVSPMVRALETAYHVFKNHPNFNNIEFIVVPKLKECLGAVVDIPKVNTLDNFKDKFPNFNCSLMQDYEDIHHFYLEDIKDEFAKKILLEKTSDYQVPCGSNVLDLLIKQIQLHYPKKPESNRNLLSRIDDVKKYISDLLQSKLDSSFSRSFAEDSKIIVVSHGTVGKFWTGKWDKPLDEYEKIPAPKKCVVINNCEFYPDIENFPIKS